jgi:hypothetical protein
MLSYLTDFFSKPSEAGHNEVDHKLVCIQHMHLRTIQELRFHIWKKNCGELPRYSLL